MTAFDGWRSLAGLRVAPSSRKVLKNLARLYGVRVRWWHTNDRIRRNVSAAIDARLATIGGYW